MTVVTTGLPSLDETLGGILPGDNVVWISDDLPLVRHLGTRFLAAGDGRRRHATTAAPADPTATAVAAVEGEIERIDLAWWLEDPDALESLLTDPAGAKDARILVDGLDEIVRRWGTTAAARFYARVCPRLFDLGAIAYWTGTREVLTAHVIEEITRVAQCVFEVREGRLRVNKAEGRPSRLQGASFDVRFVDGEVRLSREHAIGRLGEGLRRVRHDRSLTQSQLAALAGVTPAAISQAEAGRRGLSLDTIVSLCEQLGIGLDELMSGPAAPDYVLARRDRRSEDRSVTPLLDDPLTDPRAYLVRLDPDQLGEPPFHPKGPELVLVAQGLVLVDLGDSTPVLRPGDALKATRTSVRAWKNLSSEPAQIFWVVLDPASSTGER